MKQDIKEVLNGFEETNKELPAAHRTEFLEKLQGAEKPMSKPKIFNYVFKIAAIIVLFVSVGYLALDSFNKPDLIIVETPIERQLKDIEMQYLKHIDTEWRNFVALATDKNLIKRYEQKLNDLDVGYQEVIVKFKQDKNNILIVEALVENLKNRLQLLKDIQDHINLLNQKTKSYETIIL